MKVDGTCHCGFITYEAEVDPEKVYACHCTDCQAFSGGAFRWAVSIPEENLRILSGEPKAYVKRSDSGLENHQMFCPTCASPIYSKSLTGSPQRVNLRLGTARQRAELSPRIELWRCSAQDWVTVEGAAQRLEKQ